MGKPWKTIGKLWENGDLPSGKHTKHYGKIHHVLDGKTHYFDWAIFDSYLYVYQRVLNINKMICPTTMVIFMDVFVMFCGGIM